MQDTINENSTLTLVGMSEVKTASDGRQFFTAEFSPGFGQLRAKRNLWEQFKKDPKTGLPTQEKYWERGTPAEAHALIKSGAPIAGAKVTRKVEKYTIGSGETAREVDQYSTVVFPGESIVNVFASANHNIVDEETGEILGKKSAVLASNKQMAGAPVAAE